MHTIEDLISQKKFRDDYQKGLITLLYLVNQLNDFQATIFKPHDITRQQYNVLRILRGQYPTPISVAIIKDRMIDKNSDVSRIIARLDKAGFITTVASKKDKRALDILINNKGFKLLNSLEDEVNKIDQILKVLDENEIVDLNDKLTKILHKINQDKKVLEA